MTEPAAQVGPRRLSAAELAPAIDPGSFSFQLTSELRPLDRLVGQPRALRALHVAMGIRRPNYHVFAAGMGGTGKRSSILRTLEERSRSEPVPNDWVYVNNFDSTDHPVAIGLPAGSGAQLRQDMSGLVARLLEELPKAFQREDFGQEKERLRKHYRQQGEAIVEDLNRMAAERNLIVQQFDGGRLVFVPLRNGKPISQEEASQLSAEEIQRIEKHQEEVLEAAQSVFQRQQELERQLSAEVRQVERAFAERLVAPLLAEIGARYANERLTAWLDRLKGHFLVNLDRFRRRADKFAQLDPLLAESGLADVQERFFEYQVNVVVDNGGLTQAPVVIEAAPNHRNLFGTIERVVDRYGRVVTNFTRIKAGSLLRANGGYLVFDILDALAEPLVWTELKRTLKRGSIEVEMRDPFALFTISALQPEPIPLDIKLVVVGTPLLYHLLYRYDDEFRELFKFKADFDTEFTANDDAAEVYGALVEKLRQGEELPPFDAAAVGMLVRASARLAEHQGKLTAQFSRLCDLIREAAFWARDRGADIVSGADVRQALDEHVYRSDLIAAKLRELIEEGVLLIDRDGAAVGRINGLAVADLGDHAFGWPGRITASVGMGTAGIVNIERESRLSGRTYDKGLLIIEGFLRNQYAREFPLCLSASLAMEQSYGGVDGDSASVAELLCLLSAIAEVPLRQDVAVTGSINQWGEVQAIGAVNQKIEGFFDVCRQAGLTGNQGVCIPESNTRHLVLRQDVVEAVERGQFHIWAVRHLGDAIPLFTGLPAGGVDSPESLHGRVAARLRQLEQGARHRGVEPGTVVVEPRPEPPRDPRPPLPGRE